MALWGEGLYEQHAQGVYRFLFSLCSDADTAEELTQETFYQALRSQGSFRGDCSVRTWLCAIARNLWLRELDRRRRTVSAEALPAELQAPDDPADQVERQDRRIALYRAMQKLDPDTREVIHLRLAGEFSFREIGEIMGRTEAWARVRFYRGKTELAKLMGGAEHE